MEDIEMLSNHLKSIKNKIFKYSKVTNISLDRTIISIDTKLNNKYVFYYIKIEGNKYITRVYKNERLNDYYSMDIEGIIESMRIAELYEGDKGYKPDRYKRKVSRKEYYEISDGYFK